MIVCTKHPHSTPETARKCYVKRMQARVDRKMGRAQPGPPLPREYPYGRLVQLGPLTLWVFHEDGNTPYGRHAVE